MQKLKRPFFMITAGALAVMLATGAQASPNVYGGQTGYTDHRAPVLYNGLPVEAKKHDSFQVFAYGVTAINPSDVFDSSADNGYWVGVALPVYSGGSGREMVHMNLGYLSISETPVSISSGMEKAGEDAARKALTTALDYSYELYTNTQFKTRLRGQVGAARISGVTDEVSLFYGAGIELAQGRYALRLGYDRHSGSDNIESLAYMGLGINF